MGDRGLPGPAGPIGPAGPSSGVTVTASTAVSDWAETSGWANDNFTRTLTVTRESAVPSAMCGGTPRCWFYTAAVSDHGTFTTVDGHAAPNGGVITGSFTGSMDGVGLIEFYASSGAPNASLVPAAIATRSDPALNGAGTSTWAKLAFPATTEFRGGPTLTAYLWTYDAGCDAQKWVDGINPGDDGHGVDDGNITSACG
jgi:hypothetical protein